MEKQKLLRKFLLKLMKGCFEELWVVIIDDAEYVDRESLEIFDVLTKRDKIFFALTIGRKLNTDFSLYLNFLHRAKVLICLLFFEYESNSNEDLNCSLKGNWIGWDRQVVPCWLSMSDTQRKWFACRTGKVNWINLQIWQNSVTDLVSIFLKTDTRKKLRESWLDRELFSESSPSRWFRDSKYNEKRSKYKGLCVTSCIYVGKVYSKTYTYANVMNKY